MGRVIAIVPAAGAGKRFAPGANKPFFTLMGKPLLIWVLEALEAYPGVSEIIPVLKPGDMGGAGRIIEAHGFTKVRAMAEGGSERQDSVLSGLRLAGERSGVVLIHDGARPFLDGDLIGRTIEGIEGFDGAIAAVPPKDTIKEAAPGGVVGKTLERSALWAVQTPQVFPFATLLEAYERAAREGFYSTDDSALVERLGGRVKIVMGSYENIKITTPEDITVAEAISARRQGG